MGLGFERSDEFGDAFFAFGLEVDVERLLDGQHAEVGPHKFVEFAEARIEIEAGGGLGFGGGFFDVGADSGELGVALAAGGGKVGEDAVLLLMKFGEAGGGFEFEAALCIRIDGTPEEGGVRQKNESEGVGGGSGDQAERFTAGEAEAEREDSEPEVVAAFPEEAAIVGRLVGQAVGDWTGLTG